MNSESQYPQNGNSLIGSRLGHPSNWWERADVPERETLGSRPQFRQKLDSFLTRTKEFVFRKLDSGEVPRLESSEEEILGAQCYAVCPTLDLFLELDIGERIRELFRNVKIGDLVLAKVQSHVPDGMRLKLLCSDGPKRAFLEDLDLVVNCYAEDMTMKDPSDPCLQFERGDTIRCEVLKISQTTRELAIGMRGSKVSSQIQKLFPLGWVQDSELPQQYLYSSDRVKFKKETTYGENLAKRTAFNNPSVSELASILGVNSNANSFFVGLRYHFPQQSMLSSLIQVKNKKIVQKKLEKALENCRQCQFDQALDDLSAVLVLDAENVEALIERGKIYTERNACEKAKRDLQAAAKLLPDNLEQRKQLAASLLKIGVKFQKNNSVELSLNCFEDCISVISGLPGALSKLIHLNEEIQEFPSDLPGILLAKISEMKDQLKRIIAEELMKEEPANEEESMKLCDVAEVAHSTLLEDGEVLSSPAASPLDDISKCGEREEADAAPEELKLLDEEHTNKETDINIRSSERSSNRKSPCMGSRSEPGNECFDGDEKFATDDRGPVDYAVTIQQGNSRRSVVEHSAVTQREQTERSRSTRRDRHAHRKSSRSISSERGHSESRDRSREKRRNRMISSGIRNYSTQQRGRSREKRRKRMNSSDSSNYSAQQRARSHEDRRKQMNSSDSSNYSSQQRARSHENRRKRMNSSSSSDYSAQHRARSHENRRKRMSSSSSGDYSAQRRARSHENRRKRMNSSDSSNSSAQHRARSHENRRKRMNSSSSDDYSAHQRARSHENGRKRMNSSDSSNYGTRYRDRSHENRRNRMSSCSSSNYSVQQKSRKRAASAEKGRRRRSRSCEKRSLMKQSKLPRPRSRSSREVRRKNNFALAESSSSSHFGARNLKSTEEVVNEVEAYLQKLEKKAIEEVFLKEASTTSLDSKRVVEATHDSPIKKHDSTVPTNKRSRSTLSSSTPRINFALKNKNKINITPDMVSVVFTSSSESLASEDNHFTMPRSSNPPCKPLPETEESLPASQYSPSKPLVSSPDSIRTSPTPVVPKETPSSDTYTSYFPSVKPPPDSPGSSESSPHDSYSSHVSINEHQQSRGMSYTRDITNAGPMRGRSSSFRNSRSYVSTRRDYRDSSRSLSSSRGRSGSRSRKSISPNVHRVYSGKRKIPDKGSRSSTSGLQLRSTRRGSTSSSVSSIDRNRRTRYRSRSRSPVIMPIRRERTPSALREHRPPGLPPTDPRFDPNYVSPNYLGKNPIPAARFQRT